MLRIFLIRLLKHYESWQEQVKRKCACNPEKTFMEAAYSTELNTVANSEYILSVGKNKGFLWVVE